MAATPGPWFETTESRRYGGIVGLEADGHPYEDGYGGALVAESVTGANRDYLLCVHPDVGAALAVAFMDGADDADYNPLLVDVAEAVLAAAGSQVTT
jgi:hypothetical protein